MTDKFTLGRNGKFGNIDFEKLRSGITKKDLGIEANTVLSNIFDSIDNGGEENGESKGNGRLERNELQAFINKIKELAGNEKLSKREAKNYEVDGEKLGKNKEELLVFLNKLAELTKGVKQITVGNGTEIVTFEDGHTEQILANGNKIITKKQDGKTVTTTVDEDDNVLEETVEDDNFVTTTKNNPKTHKKQEVVTKNKNNNATVTTQYEDDGETPKTKEEVADDTTTQFKYNKDTQKYVPVSSDTTTSVNGKKQVVHTEYDQEKSSEDKRIVKSTSVLEYGKLVSKTVGDKTVEYDGQGNTYVIVQPDERDAGKIAEKFGCSKEKLVQVNGNRVFFNVGEKVKVPSQLEPDAPELQDRLSSEEAIKKFEEEQEAKRKAEEAARAARARAVRQARERAEAERARQSGQTGSTGGSTGTGQPRTRTETRKKYDTAIIKKEAGQLATALHNQISGASLNAKTIGLLKTITRDNVAYVVSEYQNKYGVSLAKDVDDEWGLDINTVKEHICKKLVAQAKSLGVNGIYYGDYQKINDVNQLQNWINNAAAKIRNAMANATEKYTVTEGEKPPMTHGEKQVQKQSAQQIVNELKKAISGWNDHDALRRALDKIDNPKEYKEVERLLALEGYLSDKMYSSLEKFIKEELQRIATDYTSEDLEKYVQKWISKGVIKGGAAISAQARMAARVIVDAGDGFGTDVEKTKKGIRMIKAPAGQGKAAAKKVYDQVNSIIASHRTFYGIGTRSKGLIDYLKGEVWESEIKYLKGILGENDAIQGKEKAQAVADLTEEAVSGAGTDIEYLKQAIKAINSPKDRKAVEAKLKEYCKKKGINIQLKGQAALQAILYDECDTFMGLHRDHKEIRKFNEMLISQGAYTEEEAINLRAEQAVLQILEGDYNNVMDAVAQVKDPKVLAKIDSYLQNNIIKGQKYASLQDFLNKKFGTNSVNSDLVMAELAGNNLVGDEKATDVAFRLINNSDFNKRAMGLKAIRSEKTARLVDAKLREKGSSLEQVYNQFNKEKAEYKTKSAIWDGLAFILGDIAEHISDEYRKNTDSSDNIYVEAASAKEIPPEKLQAYLTAIEAFEQNLEKMKADYQEALDSQGVVSGAINAFCSRYNIGTTRDEIEARIEHDTETLRLLKLAAKGKLSKMVNGKTVSVSFEEVFKERQSAFVSGNGASLSSIGNTIKPKEVTEFDAAKVEKVANKAQTIGAMDAVKNLVAVCWDKLDSADKSNDKKQLAAAIHDTLDKLSQLSGKALSLADYGYQLNSAGIIVDSACNEVPVSKLKEIVAKLKRGLSDISQNVLGQSIPQNSNAEQVSELLGKAYDKKMEAFKQEYRDAFGQDAHDSVIESYVSTINTGKTIVNFGAIIGAAVLAPFTGGGSLAVFGAVAGVSMGLNALEKSTDADGYTNMEWTSDAEQALWDGALAAAGMKVGQYAELFARGGIEAKAAQALIAKNRAVLSKMISNPQTLERATIWVARAEAAGFEVTSDTLQSLVQMYCQEGHFDEASFLRALFMSIGFNAAGHAWGARGDVKQGQKALDAPSREALPPPSDAKPHETPQQPKQIGSDGQNPHHVDGDADAGKVGDAPKEEPQVKEEPKAKDEPEVKENPEVKDEGANGTGRTQQQQPKTYAEMNENELFAEYQRLNKEVKYGGLSNSEKVVNINKMKEITANLEKKGFRIEGDRIVNTKQERPRTDNRAGESPRADEPSGTSAKPKFSASELKEKLGKKLYRSYQAVERSIAKLKTLADFDKISNYIAEKFKGFADVANDLMDKLVAKAKKLGLDIQEKYNNWKAKFTSGAKGADGASGASRASRPKLDKYVLKNKRNRTYDHKEYISKNEKLFERGIDHGVWRQWYPQDMHKCAWKMHLYSVDELDWQQLSEVVIPYLRDRGVLFKTFGSSYSPNAYAAKWPDQAGKAFTIYPKSNEEMAQIAKDLDYIIRKNNLQKSGSHITGDRQMGDSGRLFYRYEYKSGKYKDEVVDLNNKAESFKYRNEWYDSNRGDGKYLADDMTEADDIWHDFDPSDNNAHVSNGTGAGQGAGRSRANTARDRAYAQYDKNAALHKTPAHGMLNQDAQYLLDIDNLPQLKLCDGTVIDLNHPQIKNRIANLKEGEFVTIGVDGDIKINAGDTVSRHHILITRHNGRLAMKDVSRNGHTTCHTRPQSSQQSHRANTGREKAYSKFDKNARTYEPPRQGTLNQNAQYAIDIDNMPQLKLCDGTVIDLNHPQIKNKIANLKEGEYITIGREGDIEINGGDTVSRHHILITRHNGQIVMKDVSANGNTTCYTRPKASNQSRGTRTSRDEAYARFNQRQESINAPKNGILDRTQQYALDLDNLPKLKLIDGTVVDLDAAEFKNVIANLREGEFLTIGRDGVADIGVSSDASVSRHHILITRHNGKIVMKDISSNGRTYCRAKDAEPFDNTSSRARRADSSPRPDQMTPEQKQARIEKLEAEVRTAPVAKKLKEKFADVLDSSYVFRDGDSVDVLRRKIRNMSIDAHPDRNGGNISIELQQKINEIKDLLSKDNVNYTQVNRKLNELREYVDDLLNVDAKNVEIAKLKGDNSAKAADGASAAGARQSGRANQSSNWTWEMSNDVRARGFKRNPNAQTNVKNITADDVYVQGNYTGYSGISGKPVVTEKVGSKMRAVDTDFRSGLPSEAEIYSVYNADKNLTVIGIQCNDAFGRSGLFNISLKGQVSEADAIGLIEHLKSKDLFPKDKSGHYSTSGYEMNELKSLGDRIREEVARYFNNL